MIHDDSLQANQAAVDAGKEIKKTVKNGTKSTNRKATAAAAAIGGVVGTIGTGFNAIGGVLVAGFTGATTHIIGN